MSAPAGITVTNIVNTNGTITADVEACDAALGANTVVLKVSDGQLSATGNLTVNVVPGNPPVISIQAPLEPVQAQKKKVNHQAGSFVTFSAFAQDPEDGFVPVTFSPPSGSFLPVGTTTVTVTASDHCGNTSTATFTVEVVNKKKKK